LHAPADSSMMRQEFHLTGRADRWLPAAYEPVQLEGGDNPLVVKASSTLVSNRSDVSDLTYNVSSRQPPEALSGAQIDGTNAPLPAARRGHTRLPSDFPSAVRDAAQATTGGTRGVARLTAPSSPATAAPATSTPVGSAPTTPASAPAPRNTAQVDINAPGSGGSKGGFTFDWKIVLALAAGALVGAVGVAGTIVLAKRRRRRRRRDDPDPAGAITGAWEEVLDRLGEA